MATAIVRHAGARHVVVTDLNPYRLDVAKEMGATLAVDPRETPLDVVMKNLRMEEGFDVGLEMSGSAKALKDMVDVMCHGGKIALLGILPDRVDLDWNKVIFNMITLKGIYGREMFETWYKMTVMIQSGLDISPVITHRFPYTEFRKGFELMKEGNSGKVVLDWQ
jgi:threonine 3-dehydrogenase